MQINLQLKFADQTEKTITATAADLIAFESEFNLSVAKLENEVRLTHLLFIAWHAEKRTKTTGLEFQAWVETVESIEAKETKK